MTVIRYILALCVATALVGCDNRATQPVAKAAEPIDSIPMMVMQIQQCSRLYTTEYKVRKIITQDDEQAVSGKLLGRPFSVTLPTGKRSVAIPIDATIKGYIDFADFSASNIIRSGDRIEIVLPDPQVVMTSTRIDHDNAKERVPLLRTHYTDAELSAIERRQCCRPAHTDDRADGLPARPYHHYVQTRLRSCRPYQTSYPSNLRTW